MALLAASLLALPLPPGGAATAYKVPTANPNYTRGSTVSGNYLNVQTQDNTFMRQREGTVFFFLQYFDAEWRSWQSFNEAPRGSILDIQVELVGYQSDASESWFVQFYNYNTSAWDSTWYALGSLPTSPSGNLLVSVGDAARARSFVSAAGAFRLRFADSSTAEGGWDFTRTDIYIDLLRASFVYDAAPPVSGITSPVDGEYTGASAYTIRGTSSDPQPDASGVVAVDVSVDGGGTWNAAAPAAPGDFSTWSYVWGPIPSEGTYNIRSRARDAVGNVETPGPGISLVVDWTPPQVASTTPPDGDINVGVDAIVSAVFVEANGMDAATINSSTFTMVDEEGTVITGAVSYDPATLTATFDPDTDLFYGYRFTATLSTGITDLAGNPLPADYSWTFRTADILSMTLSETWNRDGTPGGGSVGFGTMNPDQSPFVVGGGTPPCAINLKVLSSTNWNLLLRAVSDLVDNAQVPPVVMSISRLSWRLTGGGTWVPFTLLDAEVFQPARARTPQPLGEEVSFELRLDLDWEDPPGNYSTGTVFVLMEQP